MKRVAFIVTIMALVGMPVKGQNVSPFHTIGYDYQRAKVPIVVEEPDTLDVDDYVDEGNVCEPPSDSIKVYPLLLCTSYFCIVYEIQRENFSHCQEYQRGIASPKLDFSTLSMIEASTSDFLVNNFLLWSHIYHVGSILQSELVCWVVAALHL